MGFFDVLGEMIGEKIASSVQNMNDFSAWLDEQPDEKLIRECKRASGTKKIMIAKKLKERGYGAEVL